MSQTSLVNAAKKSAHPILKERQALTDSLRATLVSLGLQRVPRKGTDALDEYVEARWGNAGGL